MVLFRYQDGFSMAAVTSLVRDYDTKKSYMTVKVEPKNRGNDQVLVVGQPHDEIPDALEGLKEWWNEAFPTLRATKNDYLVFRLHNGAPKLLGHWEGHFEDRWEMTGRLIEDMGLDEDAVNQYDQPLREIMVTKELEGLLQLNVFTPAPSSSLVDYYERKEWIRTHREEHTAELVEQYASLLAPHGAITNVERGLGATWVSLYFTREDGRRAQLTIFNNGETKTTVFPLEKPAEGYSAILDEKSGIGFEDTEGNVYYHSADELQDLVDQWRAFKEQADKLDPITKVNSPRHFRLRTT